MWYYVKDAEIKGPIEIEDMLKVIDSNTLIWDEDGTESNWNKAEFFPNIKMKLKQSENNNTESKFNHLKYLLIFIIFLVTFFPIRASLNYYYLINYVDSEYSKFTLFEYVLNEYFNNFLNYLLIYPGIIELINTIQENNPENISLYYVLMNVIKLIGVILIPLFWFRNYKKSKIV